MSVSTVFLLLLIYTVGIVWAKYLPRAEWVEGTRFQRFGPIIHFLNPGEFQIKEVCFPSLAYLCGAHSNWGTACHLSLDCVHGRLR